MELPADTQEAFLRVYDANADAVFRHCYLRIRDREKARDLMQESFLRTWTYLSNGNKIDNMRAFVYRVANNLIVDEARKKRETSLEALQEQTNFDQAAKDSGTEAEEVRILAKDAKAVLASLPPIYQEVLTLRFVEEFTPKEIAEILHTSQTVVSVRLWRGLRKLKALLPA